MYEGDKMSPEFKARIDRQRRRFARSLLKARVKLNVNGPIASLGDNAIPMLEYDSVYDESKPLRLNSRLEAYFQAHIFLGGELNAIELGEVYAHPGARDVAGWESKRYSKDPGDNDTMRTWSELDESVRLLAQSKRTVIPGATMHTLVQGLDNGVNHTMHLAVIDDVKGYVQNILGKKEDGAKSSDGSALSFALHGRLENNSLQDARAGVDRKTIGHGMNRDLASPQLLKFATFDITNTRRQAAYGSDIDLEDLYKRMGNFKAFSAVAKDGNVTMKDLIKLYEQWGGYDNENGFKRQIYKQDPTSLEYYRLDVNRENNTFLWVLVDKNGLDIFNAKHKNIVQPASTEVNYWYDVDQLFGGCWSMVLDENTKELVFGEGNIDMMEQLAASKTELKDCYIAMAVNSSAIKVGAMNVNDSKA